MSQDECTKLFTYIQKRFDTIEANLESKADKDQANLILNTLDQLAKNQETNDQERLVISHQLDELETRLTKLETKAA